jgi:hypothetical protein
MEHNIYALVSQAQATYNRVSKEPDRTRLGFGATTNAGIFLDNVFGGDLSKLEIALEVYDNPLTHTPANLAKLHAAKAQLEKSFRTLYGYIEKNPAVTDEDRIMMKMPVYPIDHPVDLTTFPVPTVEEKSIHRRITINYRDSATPDSKARPYGVSGAIIRYKVFDTPQEGIGANDLTQGMFSDTTPFHVNFTEEQRGKYFHYSMRWSGSDDRPTTDVRWEMIP